MIVTSNTLVNLLAWLAETLGLALDLPEDLLTDALEALDERSVSEQLRYGRT